MLQSWLFLKRSAVEVIGLEFCVWHTLMWRAGVTASADSICSASCCSGLCHVVLHVPISDPTDWELGQTLYSVNVIDWDDKKNASVETAPFLFRNSCNVIVEYGETCHDCVTIHHTFSIFICFKMYFIFVYLMFGYIFINHFTNPVYSATWFIRNCCSLLFLDVYRV